MDGVGFMPADAEPGDLAIKRLRLFAGYSGWGSGQLEDELAEDSWIVVDAVDRGRVRRRSRRALAHRAAA